MRTLRTHLVRLRRKSGKGAENPTCVFTEIRASYRMPKGETQGEADA